MFVPYHFTITMDPAELSIGLHESEVDVVLRVSAQRRIHLLLCPLMVLRMKDGQKLFVRRHKSLRFEPIDPIDFI